MSDSGKKKKKDSKYFKSTPHVGRYCVQKRKTKKCFPQHISDLSENKTHGNLSPDGAQHSVWLNDWCTKIFDVSIKFYTNSTVERTVFFFTDYRNSTIITQKYISNVLLKIKEHLLCEKMPNWN